MAIFDNIKNVFKTTEKEAVKEVKEAPIVYYNSLGVDYQQKTRYDQLACLLYTSPSPRDGLLSRMPSSA